ncbi:hypothetical protein EON65_41825 [archaeon]|nr:MAG: hypothetical protein EON65_41825 [archaeon]
MPIVERNLFPDVLLRMGIKQEIEMELVKMKKRSAEDKAAFKSAFVKELLTMPIAVAQTKANDQHYEVPDEFYQLVLGPCMKYSSGFWPTPSTTLAQSEVHMLEKYCERAQLFDGMKLIDLGCGWGSVTLYMAAKYPKASIVSISNSNSQREYIMEKARERGLNNVQVYTGKGLGMFGWDWVCFINFYMYMYVNECVCL